MINLENGVKYLLTIIHALRGTGKSFTIKSVFRKNMLYIDMRRYEGRGYILYKDLIEEFNSAINKNLEYEIKEIFKNISGINIFGNSLSLSWKKDKVKLMDIFEAINNYYNKKNENIIIIDEIQELIKLKGYNFLNDIAYSFDNFKNLNSQIFYGIYLYQAVYLFSPRMQEPLK